MFTQREFVDAALSFPFSKAASKVTLNTGRCLVAFLGGLGEKLHDDCRDRGRDILISLSGWCWLPGNVAVHPLHRVRSREGKTRGQHFVKCDAEGIEIAPGIDGTIHSSGLLGCHIGECPADRLWRLGKLALTWKPRSDTKAHQPALAGDGVYQNIGRLDVLMDNAVLMQAIDRGRHANSHKQRKR